MSARDEALISEGRKMHNAWFDGPDMEQRDRMIRMAKVAREIHQPRRITTVEELDALPDGSIVLDRTGDTARKFRGGWRTTVAEPDGTAWLSGHMEEADLPATVLFTPKES